MSVGMGLAEANRRATEAGFQLDLEVAGIWRECVSCSPVVDYGCMNSSLVGKTFNASRRNDYLLLMMRHYASLRVFLNDWDESGSRIISFFFIFHFLMR